MSGNIRHEVGKFLSQSEDNRITCEEMQKLLIEETVFRFKGNKTHAARALGISVRTLRDKMKRYSNGQEET